MAPAMATPKAARSQPFTGAIVRRAWTRDAGHLSVHAGRLLASRRRRLPQVRPDQLERRLHQRLDARGRVPRAELLRVLMLPDLERAERIGEFWSYPHSRTFAELLIDCEEDRKLRAVLVGILREK
jgi:hypothetical protein